MGCIQSFNVSKGGDRHIQLADGFSVYALHFHDISSTTFTKLPPLLERPGQAPSFDKSLTSTHSASKPSYAGKSFPYFCQFWCVVHEIAAMYYSSSKHIHEHVPLAYAESKFRQLLAWADSLPPDCSRHEGMPHNVAEMQYESFHNCVYQC